MSEGTLIDVTIDRISNSGNYIADEFHNGKHIHVKNGIIGQKCRVEIVEEHGGCVKCVKRKRNAQKKAPSKERREQLENILEERQKSKKEIKEKAKEEAECKNENVKTREKRRERTKKEQERDKGIAYGHLPNEGNGNKNDLLNGKL